MKRHIEWQTGTVTNTVGEIIVDISMLMREP